MNIDTHDKFKAPPPTTSELKLRSILRYKKIPFKHSQIIWYTGCDKYTPDYDMMVAEAFLRSLVNLYGRHIVYSDGDTSYPEACTSLGLKHILHSSFEKSIV